MRIDSSSGKVDKVVNLAYPPQALAGTAAGIYVAVRSSGLEHRGGTLRVRQIAPDFLDPARAYSEMAWAILPLTNDGLVGFRRVGGIAGVQLVPDLAVALPTPSDAGRTYTFRLRPDVRYSTGKLLQPADFRRAIERDLEAAKPPSPGGMYFAGIVGAAACRAGRPCDLSRGIVADTTARTVTFHLTAPDADFLSKLTLPFAYAAPAGTPAPSATADHAVPGTGPYMIVGYRRNKSLRLVRNRHFREWSADAQPGGYPDRLVFTFPRDIPGSSIRAVRSVLHGDADVVLDADVPPLSKQQLTALATRYPSQLRLSASAATNFFFLNTHVSPFDDVRVRRAVNYALDRRAYVGSLGPGFAPTCQILPPNYPAYRRTCLYGSGGKAGLDRARRMVRRAGKTGVKVTVWIPAPIASQADFIVSLLNSIGLQAHVKALRPGQGVASYFSRILDPRTQAQMGFYGWVADFPSDAGFLPPILSCAAFSTSPEQNSDASEFCDPAVDRLFAKAEKAQSENPPAATALWQKAERAILEQAPLLPTYHQEHVSFLAKGIGNFQYHAPWQVLLDQLWLK
jgi:peptide/nickel transport system substrate-binding protein